MARRNRPITRRTFLQSSAALAAFSIVPAHVLGGSGRAPGEKLNIGCVGVGGMQGGHDVDSVASENIYALCDIDEKFLDKAAAKYPSAKKYRDFREMIDKEQKNLDGITITIPDHMHATVALFAMERGIAVHCQKPLTQTVWEAPLLTTAARKYKVATQMGNQGYSSVATRVACETIWSGQLGDITEVHGMSGGGFARNITEWPAPEPAPLGIDWDTWTGRAEYHTYSPKIHPSNWRGFLDYGTQMIGDWGIHILGPANWGLQLGSPTSVECTAVEGVNPVTYPHYSCVMEFPERPNSNVPSGKMPPVKVFWYEGKMVSNFKLPAEVSAEDFKNCNALYIGTQGLMATGGRGESMRLVPQAKMKDWQKPKEIIPRVKNHFQEWLGSIRDGHPADSNFSIAGPYTEWMLLGAISWRFPNEKLLWDGKNLRFTNNEKANEYVKPRFRKGWELPELVV